MMDISGLTWLADRVTSSHEEQVGKLVDAVEGLTTVIADLRDMLSYKLNDILAEMENERRERRERD